MSSIFLEADDPRGVANVTLNRPGHHNAFDDRLIAKLTASRRALGRRPDGASRWRASAEGHEGITVITALLDKRPLAWRHEGLGG